MAKFGKQRDTLPVPGEQDFGHAPNLVDEIVRDCQALGIVGEQNLVLAIYLIGTSRLLARPLAAIVQGKSSSGKSNIVHKVARLFPDDVVLNATRITPQALYHYKSLAHRFVLAGERSRVQDDTAADATAALRQLQSEGRITKLITGTDGPRTSELVRQEGPIAYIETTTLQPSKIFPEDLNRALLLRTDETERQTRQILDADAARYEAPQEADVAAIIEKHHTFQSSLEPIAVTIPFARRLMSEVPARQVEARRVGPQILSMIEAVTLLHQFQRQKDDADRLLAEAQDYEVAAKILRQPLGESLGVTASATKLYEKIAAKYPNGKVFDTSAVQQLDTAEDRTVRGWLAQLAAHECVVKVAEAEGPKPATWRLNGRAPGETVLPAPEVIGLVGSSRLKAKKPANTQANVGFGASRLLGSGKGVGRPSLLGTGKPTSSKSQETPHKERL
jgi:hypothetical protein